MPIKVPLQACSLLDCDLGPTDTEARVVVGTGPRFGVLEPDQYYYATLVHPQYVAQFEVVKVTRIIGDRLRIVRGQDGTGLASFPKGSLIEARWNPAQVKDLACECLSGLDASGIAVVPTGSLTATTVQQALQDLTDSLSAGIKSLQVQEPLRSSGGIEPTLSLMPQDAVVAGSYYGLTVNEFGVITETPTSLGALGPTGSLVIPPGLVLKWGSFAAASSVVFPTPFTSACWVATYTPVGASAHGASALTVNGFTIDGGPSSGTYIALGN